MTTTPEQESHPLWEIAQNKLGKNSQNPAAYRVRPNCFILVNSDGDVITVTIETTRDDIPFSRECFALNPDGSCNLTVSAEIVSGLTDRISVATKTIHSTPEDLNKRNILGYNWVRDQLDLLAKKLSSRHLKRVDPRDRTKIIEKNN